MLAGEAEEATRLALAAWSLETVLAGERLSPLM